MQPLGHVSVAWYLTRRHGARPRDGAMVLAGTLAPDVIDKSFLYLDLTPFGRTFGHAPVVCVLMILGLMLWGERSRKGPSPLAFLFVLGVWGHLLADLSNDALRGWLFTGFALDGWVGWPWLEADDYYLRLTPFWLCRQCLSPLELGVIGWALWDIGRVLRRRRERGREEDARDAS